MRRGAMLILAGTLAALVVATLWVPAHDWVTWDDGPQDLMPWLPDDTEYVFVAALWAPPTRCVLTHVGAGWTRMYPVWPLLLGTHGVILLLGGGVLTRAVRRERRRAEDWA